MLLELRAHALKPLGHGWALCDDLFGFADPLLAAGERLIMCRREEQRTGHEVGDRDLVAHNEVLAVLCESLVHKQGRGANDILEPLEALLVELLLEVDEDSELDKLVVN